MVRAESPVTRRSPTRSPTAGGKLDSGVANLESDADYGDRGAKLLAVNEENESTWIHLKDYVRVAAKKSSKLMPDLDFDKVALDRSRQFKEFVRMYSAIEQE